MSKLTVIAVLVSSTFAQAATYHFSTTDGNDIYSAVQAQNPSTPWASLAVLDTLTLQAGDSVLFETGETFVGEIVVPASGTNQDPIVYASYGNLSKPVISGCTPVNGTWTNDGGGQYHIDIAEPVHQLFLDGEPMTLARYPNEGYLQVDAVTQVRREWSDGDLAGGDDWTGARVHVRTQPWSLDARVVTGYVVGTGTITIDRDANYDINENEVYFLNNHLAALDSVTEWFYDSAAGKLYVMPPDGNMPGDGAVTVTQYDVGIEANNRSYVTVEGLSFVGHYDRGIYVHGSSHHVTVADCDALYANGTGIDVSSGDALTVSGCSSVGANYYGMRFRSNGGTCTRNVVRKVGMIGRLGKDGLGGGCCAARGLQFEGSGSTCSYNSIDSIGYNGLGFGGENQLIERNTIRYYCLTTYDGSAIYTWSSDYALPGAAGTIIRQNIIEGGIGPDGGVVQGNWWANGIYLDDRTRDITVDGNTISNAYHGIYFHNTKRHEARDNVVFNCSDYSILFREDDNGAAGEMADNVVVGNQVFALSDRYQCVRPSGNFNVFDYGRLDSNRYWNPYNEFSVQVSYKPGYPGDGTTQTQLLTLAQWQDLSGDDLHSLANTEQWLPFTVTDTLGAQMITNGTFDSTVDDWGCWPCPPGGVSWDTHSELDDGCAAIRLDYVDTVTYALAITNQFTITEGSTYLLTFSAVAPKAMTLRPIVRLGVSPYSAAGLSASVVVDTMRKDYAFVFEGALTSTQCRIDFDHKQGDSLFWMDNVSLYEVSAEPGNGLERARLFVNATEESAAQDLEGMVWLDLDGNEVRGAMSLEPYTSRILIKDRVDTMFVQGRLQSRLATLPGIRVRGGSGVLVTFRPEGNAGTISLLTIAGRVVDYRRFAADERRVAQRWNAVGAGMYLVRVTLDSGVSASRAVVVTR